MGDFKLSSTHRLLAISQCSVCMENKNESKRRMLLTNCAHRACEGCYERSLNFPLQTFTTLPSIEKLKILSAGKFRCLTCDQGLITLSEDTLFEELRNTWVTCPHDPSRCSWKGRFDEAEAHSSGCAARFITCNLCNVLTDNRAEFSEHHGENKCCIRCVRCNRLNPPGIHCGSCFVTCVDCKQSVPLDEKILHHDYGCAAQLPCGFCGALIVKARISSSLHVRYSCLLAPGRCPFPGCSETFPRVQLDDHLLANLNQHYQLEKSMKTNNNGKRKLSIKLMKKLVKPAPAKKAQNQKITENQRRKVAISYFLYFA